MHSEELCCPICYYEYDTIDHLPRIIINCGHSVCAQCLSALIKGSDTLKCPLDKKSVSIQELTVDLFPINYALLQVLEGNSGREFCKDHKTEQVRFVCITDQCHICDDCALYGEHRDHEVKSMKKIKREADVERKSLENALANLEKQHKHMGELLNEKRLELLRDDKGELPRALL